jgi:hypothetical protein
VTAIRFVSRPTFRDIIGLTVDQTFRSLGAQAVHGFGWGVAAFGIVAGAPLEIWLPPALIGVLFGSGSFALLFVWWTYGRSPESLVETVTAGGGGILIEAPSRQVRQAWGAFREARETATAFLLSAPARPSQVLGKRGVSEEALQGFRALLQAARLLRDDPIPTRGIVGFVGGAAIAIVMPFALGAAGVG